MLLHNVHTYTYISRDFCTGNVCIAYVSTIKLKSLSHKKWMWISRTIRSVHISMELNRHEAFFWGQNVFVFQSRNKDIQEKGQKDSVENKTHHPKCIQSIQLEGKQSDRTDCMDKYGLFVPLWLAATRFPLHYTCWCLLLKSIGEEKIDK